MFDLAHEIAQTLRRNRLRTALTGIAVAWGIFMLIVLLGAARGVENAVSQHLNIDQQRTLQIWPGSTTLSYKGYRDGRNIELRNADMAALQSTDHAHCIKSVEGLIYVDTARVSTISERVSGGLKGVEESGADNDRITMTHGRFITARDNDTHAKNMVIKADDAVTLFGSADSAVGRRVEAMGLSWTVVGVYTNNWQRGQYVPRSTLTSIIGNDGTVNSITVQMTENAMADMGRGVQDQVVQTLSRRHTFDPEDAGAVYISNRLENLRQQNNAILILKTAVWVIGILTLLSGIVGVSNIMFVSVRERVHEIGIRRAIGARPRSIMLQVVAESVAVTALFGYTGVFFGMLVTEGLNQAFGDSDFMKNPTVNLSMALQITVLLVIIGALAGLFPAYKATRVRPVEALRDE